MRRRGSNTELDAAIHQAQAFANQGRPVVVDVKIDYSKRTAFTEGVVKTNFQRFTLVQKARAVSRALVRKVTG